MRLKIVVFLILCLYTTSIFAGAVSADDWPIVRHDPSHTGYTTDTGSSSNSTVWSYTTGASVESSPVISGGFIYFGAQGAA